MDRITAATLPAPTADGVAPVPVVPAAARLGFLDALRGVALILMVLNHTSRWWLDVSMGWGRYWLVYGSVILPAPIFLFLVGFCLPISYRRRPAGIARLLRTYGQRGLVIIGAGLLLNVLVFPGEGPVWSGGVLQTIGLSIVLLAPCLPLLPRPAGRVALAAVAAGLYVGFALAVPGLRGWVTDHRLAAEILFLDFPPWPWGAAALVGLVLGWEWLEARAQGPARERRFFAWVAAAGGAALAWYVLWEALVPTSPRFGFPRDFILNRHWTPRGATLALIAGGVALLLAGAYWLMQVRGVALPRLVVLGQTALMLYFVHQLIAHTLLQKALGVRFDSWAAYWAANAVFLLLLLGLGQAWLAVRARFARGARSPAPGARR